MRDRNLSMGLCALASAVFFAPAVGAAPPIPSSGCSAVTIDSGRRIERTIDVDGVTRAYILDVPESLRPGFPAPLLLDFHGFGHSGAGFWRVSGFRALAEREGFITAYPDGLPVTLPLRGKIREGRGWEISSIAGNRDLAFTRAMLDRLERELCIDRSRVFATGFSNGAYLSSLLGCAMADRIAAIAPVSGGVLPMPCKPSRGVPVLMQHGRLDDLIPPESARAARDQWIAADECKGTTPLDAACVQAASCRNQAVVRYCEGNYAHTWPAGATQKIWTFFRQHPMPPR